MQKHIPKPCSCISLFLTIKADDNYVIKACRKPSSLPSLASIMTYKKSRDTNEESTKKVLADDRNLDVHGMMRKIKFCKDGGYVFIHSLVFSP
jgi:hypothetical protein